MLIDAHCHVLGLGAPPGVDRFMKEMFRSYFQAKGTLPTYRPATDGEWKPLQYSWVPSTRDEIIKLHPNFDKIIEIAES